MSGEANYYNARELLLASADTEMIKSVLHDFIDEVDDFSLKEKLLLKESSQHEDEFVKTSILQYLLENDHKTFSFSVDNLICHLEDYLAN